MMKRRRLTPTTKHPASISMSTRSKKASVDGMITDTVDRAHWSAADESALVFFLLEHKSEAGDGANFKAQTWKAAAEVLGKTVAKGGPKTAASCKNKWQRVHHNLNFFSFRSDKFAAQRNLRCR